MKERADTTLLLSSATKWNRNLINSFLLSNRTLCPRLDLYHKRANTQQEIMFTTGHSRTCSPLSHSLTLFSIRVFDTIHRMSLKSGPDADVQCSCQKRTRDTMGLRHSCPDCNQMGEWMDCVRGRVDRVTSLSESRFC